VLLDDQAQIQTISEKEDTEALALAQPLAEMGLDVVDGPSTTNAIVINEGVGGLSDEEESGEGDESDESEDESDYDPEDVAADPEVLRQHLLADIFDTAPAFALPPIEDLFYRVTGLLAKKKN
jgi:NET1-associated nuclear protein 1 (U3 small nucleolar RNA-associated protein 17)